MGSSSSTDAGSGYTTSAASAVSAPTADAAKTQSVGFAAPDAGNKKDGYKFGSQDSAASLASRTSNWSEKAADSLQESVDRIFAGAGKAFYDLEFSFTIADPSIDDCPLVGCSTGFTTLCGYGLDEIVGRNCRFLIDPVPKDQIDPDMRRLSTAFCQAIKHGKEFKVAESDRKAWMPEGRPPNELVCMQRNMRQDGSLFNNMFYMKSFFLGSDMDEEQPYIIALQSEMPKGKEDLTAFANNLEKLDGHMTRLTKELASLFFMQCDMSRQLRTEQAPQISTEEDDTTPIAPNNLDSAFDPEKVQPWDASRFRVIKKLCDATRNRGVVNLMEDQQNDKKLVAVKKMPNSWLCKSHAAFIKSYANETELPWIDIGCTHFLSSVNYKYACTLEGVFRDGEHSFVNFSYAAGGDLFDVALAGVIPGPEREESFAALVPEICTALKLLHEMGIAHRDVSLENILLIKGVTPSEAPQIRLIDFAMASRERTFRNQVRGKPSYQAPEMHDRGQEYDAFTTDAFAVGTIFYSLFLRDYPWLSTKPGGCMHFEYVKKHGFKLYCAKRKVRGSPQRVAECISTPLSALLEGLLSIDPFSRLTMGEKRDARRRSVWNEPWLQSHQSKA